jgi:hypothetical protein
MVLIAETPYFVGLLRTPSHAGYYPLLYAALRPDTRFLRFLLEKGARVLRPRDGAYRRSSLLHLLIGYEKTIALHVILLDLDTPNKYSQAKIDALFAFKTRPPRRSLVQRLGPAPLTPIELAARMGVRFYRGSAALRLRAYLEAHRPMSPPIYM